MSDDLARLKAALEQEQARSERLEKALAEERFLLNALMQTIPDHLYFKDRESRFLRISSFLADSFGFSDPGLAIGKTDFDFFSEEHARQARADEIAVMESRQSIMIEEKETWPDKPDTWVSTTKAPLFDAEGNVVGTFGISKDITQRKRIQAQMEAQMRELEILNTRLTETQGQLVQSEKMASVGQLAAGVAHEINNPIGFINSNLRSLKQQVGDLLSVLDAYRNAEPALHEHPEAMADIEQAKARIDLDFIREDIGSLVDESLTGIDRVKTIVNSLKEFSRVDTAEWHFTNLENGLESTLNVVWNELKEKADVKRNYVGLPEIKCMGFQINQVFMNLLINAAEAIEQHGTISLTTHFDEQNVWVEIADTGRGIAPEHLAKVFEPFFTTKPIGQGTGLGLSLAYGIVQRHHGELAVRSTPGQGSVFRITLPRKQTDDAASAGENPD